MHALREYLILMSIQYTDAQLYNQLRYFAYLFDTTKVGSSSTPFVELLVTCR